jgi:hypothetical protein
VTQEPSWKLIVDGKAERVPTLGHLFDEFKTCFGQSFGVDLSSQSEERPMAITLTEEAYEQYIEGHHPFLTGADLDYIDGEENETGEMIAYMRTGRLQSLVEQYAIERLPELFDKKKINLQFDKEILGDHTHNIFETLHDYVKAGIISWPKNMDLPSSEKVDEMLEIAWNEALQLYRQETPSVRR